MSQQLDSRVFPKPGVYYVMFKGSDFFSSTLVLDVADGFIFVGWGEDDQPHTGNVAMDSIDGPERRWIALSEVVSVSACFEARG